ncbi:alpha/beta fold hydrolase [Streptosporangium subroseum]|uniref:alpha/beta fold hydrolase n=1 Tax=Streptosporangium subroseum TaxID=106412 RepID=UPI00342F77C9
MVEIRHLTATVAGQQVFYREAGPAEAPTVVLLHGFPTSSHMFRHLIPLLADRYHVIAPDHIGFGQSSMPSVKEFPYSFDALTDITAGLLGQLGVEKFAIYVQDYGAPIGWRLATRDPRPRAGHRDHHPERQRLHRRVRRFLLERAVRLRLRPGAGHRAPRARRPVPGQHPLAVPQRGRRPRPRQPGHLGPRPAAAGPARQRRDPANALTGKVRRVVARTRVR